MTVLVSVALPGGTVSPTSGGSEIDGSRRLIDFTDLQHARLSYGGAGLGDCAIGINFSLDSGASWTVLIPRGPNLAASGIVLSTEWTDVSFLQGKGDVMLCAMAYGTALLGGLLYAVKFIDLQLR